MLTIRLSQVGKKNKKMYRLIISEKARDTFGRALEILGSYNPHSKELVVKADRIKHWISNGAGMSPTVNNLLITNKIIEGKKVKASKKGTPKKVEEKKEAPKEEKTTEEAKTEETPVITEEVTAPVEEAKEEVVAPVEKEEEKTKEVKA